MMTAESNKKFICLWTIPVGGKPVVRVEVDSGSLRAQKLFEIGCNAMGMSMNSRPFFALFRGTVNPTKKYGTNENIYIPCKAILTIQRWSFDFKAETKIIKTDAVAFRLIALQFMSDMDNGKVQLTKEETERLKEYNDPKFVCYKQFVEECRQLSSYNTLSILDVEVMNEAKLITTTLKEGTKVNLVLSARKMVVMSDSVELGIPWRKIRQFAEVKETKTINLEVFLADEKAFTWLELQSSQGTLLLQAMGEFIDVIRAKVERPMFRQPNWVGNRNVNKLSWSMIKSELFGVGKQEKKEKFETFDDINCSSSEDEGEEEEIEESRLSLNNVR